MRIKLSIGDEVFFARLNTSATAQKVAAALPLEAQFDTWGDEIYFRIPVDNPLEETAREEVEPGDIGYWPTGNAFCVFFGPTPMSTPEKIIPASAVNLIGRMEGDPARLKAVMHEGRVRLEPA